MVLAMVYRLYTIGTCLEVKALREKQVVLGSCPWRVSLPRTKQANTIRHLSIAPSSFLWPWDTGNIAKLTNLGQTLTKLAVVAE